MTAVRLTTVDELEPVEHRQYDDQRGALVPIELLQSVPFAVVRLFWIRDVPVGMVRGAHAHKACHQYLICVAGSVRVDVYDGHAERSIPLKAGHALHVPPGIFSSELYDLPGSILIVLCSRPYEVDDYLHEKRDLVAFRRQASGGD
jgi:mannose-6-phosphate isomerase-like protein (cupin superfamily)